LSAQSKAGRAPTAGARRPVREEDLESNVVELTPETEATVSVREIHLFTAGSSNECLEDSWGNRFRDEPHRPVREGDIETVRRKPTQIGKRPIEVEGNILGLGPRNEPR
jgi:hypothetical protein